MRNSHQNDSIEHDEVLGAKKVVLVNSDGDVQETFTTIGDGLQKLVTASATPEVISTTELKVKWAKVYPIAADGSQATGDVKYGFAVLKCYGLVYPGGTQFEWIDLSKLYVKVSVNGEGVAIVYATN
jgi:hypothetical protein